ncbi:hypothetical protein BBJ28_00000052 [Nothophytophthora sp. Chile5]|nr:hypothetical protein BBJ28_00000052 [Nothophytophthora sp. Chile5]
MTTCEAENDGGSVISASSVSSMPDQPADAKGGDAMGSALSGESDFESCNPTRGIVLTHSNGSRYCECAGDWRNPPTCDEFSYLKAVLTILGALATVLSILFSVRAFIKSRKNKAEAARKAGASGDNDKEGDSDDNDDVLSVRVIHIGGKLRLGTPGSRGQLPLGTPGSSLPQPSLRTDTLVNPPKETTL